MSKIFGIGLSKTGTTSLYAALSMLGYRSATFSHMQELGLKDWFRGDFNKDYFSEFDAITDLPVAAFIPQLDKKYPNSKFILTTRDIDAWLGSCKKQFSSRPKSKFIEQTRLITYGTLEFNYDKYRYIYETHMNNMEWYFRDRRDDLLILNLFEGEGWDQLCSFLNKPVIEADFPNVKPGYQAKTDKHSLRRKMISIQQKLISIHNRR